MTTGESERERRVAALDASIARGLADSKAGRVIDIEDVMALLGTRYGLGRFAPD